MKQMLYKRDATAIQQEQTEATEHAKKLQVVLNKVKELGLFEIISSSELESLVRNPEYAEDRIISNHETPTFMGKKMDKKAIMKNFPFPDLFSLREAIAECQDIYNFTVFKVSAGTVSVPDTAMKVIDQKHTFYTLTDKETELFEKFQNTLKPMQEFYAAMKQHGLDTMLIPNTLGANATEVRALYTHHEKGIKLSETFSEKIIRAVRHKEQK